jgi:hypothetical protein
MTRKITNDEYLALALRYNEQRTINDSLQKEVTELKTKNEMWGKYVEECMLDIDRLNQNIFWQESADEYNNRNRIS